MLKIDALWSLFQLEFGLNVLLTLKRCTGGRQEGSQPTILHSSQVDVRGAQLAGRRVAVVGGGMTAATLVLAAAAAGASEVQLISRRYAWLALSGLAICMHI